MAILDKGENLIRESKASEKDAIVKKGFLLLTNRRLIFEGEQGLPFNKKRNTAFNASLQQVRNVGTEGMLTKFLTVEISWPDRQSMGNARTIKKYKFTIPQAADWEVEIRAAVQQRR